MLYTMIFFKITVKIVINSRNVMTLELELISTKYRYFTFLKDEHH